MTLETKDIMSAALSSSALLVSLFSFALTYRHTRRTTVLSRKPVLVFVYDGQRGWVLKNVGNGPALNVIVAQMKNDKWFCRVRVPPIAKDGEFIPLWLGHVNDTGLGATYADTEGFPYSSITHNDLTNVYEGLRLSSWLEKQIGKHWQDGPCR
jgi:hypothetical protein